MTATPLNKPIIAICIVAIVAGLYVFNPFPLYFLNDDLVHIPLSRDWAMFQHKSFRPICDISIALDYWMWAKSAYGYHITNLLLHILNSIMLFWLANVLSKQFNVPNAFSISLSAATLFFVYAFHSEAIFWILGRSASLGCMFFIPATVFYLRRDDGIAFFFLSLTCFTLGLMTYESVWIFPMVAAIISIVRPGNKKKEWRYVLSTVILFAIYMVVRKQTIGAVVSSYEAAAFFDWNLKALLLNFARLFGRSMLPPMINSAYFIGALIGLFAVVALFFVIYHKKFSALILMIAAVLVISFIPYLSLGIDTHSVEGERYLYLPTLLVALLLSLFIFQAISGLAGRSVVLGVLLSLHVLFLFRASNFYRTASAISKTTFIEINKLQRKKLFVDSLPQSVCGALVFRTGFESGIQWLTGNGTIDSVYIGSIKCNNYNWSKSFGVDYSSSVNRLIFTSVFVRDATYRENYYKKQVVPMQFNAATDAWFIYKDDRLQVVK